MLCLCCKAYGNFAIYFTFCFTSVYILVIWSDGVFNLKNWKPQILNTVCHDSVEITNKMQLCNRIYYSNIH